MEGKSPPKTIVILPVYNESSTLKAELEKLRGKADLLVIINDGSTDGSGEIIQEWIKERQGIIFINRDSNSGKADALREAFRVLLKLLGEGEVNKTDRIVITDADGQLPANAIPGAVEYFMGKKLEVLIGSRDFAIYPPVKIIGNHILSGLASFLTGFEFHDTQCGFRVLTIEALERILPCYTAHGYACEQQLSIIPALLGMKMDNSFQVKPAYYRSNSTYRDAFYIAFDSLDAFFRVRKKMK